MKRKGEEGEKLAGRGIAALVKVGKRFVRHLRRPKRKQTRMS